MFGARRLRAFDSAGLCLLLVTASLAAVRVVSARAHVAASATPAAAPVQLGPMPLLAPGETAKAPGAVESRDARDAHDVRDGRDGHELNDTLHVLLIGNSYTLHHTLNVMLQHVAAGVPGGPRLVVDAEARGGYSLRNHWRNGLALARIRSGHYTHVVLQGHSLSAVDHPDELAADAERFKQAIDAADARTVFYETWARSPEARMYLTNKIVHSFEEMTERVANTYFGLSQRLGAGIAPVGRAFERAVVQQPKLALWGSDGSHPTVAGSYMAACVLYGALTGADPRATLFVPPELSESEAVLIRGIATQSLHDDHPAPAVLNASASLL